MFPLPFLCLWVALTFALIALILWGIKFNPIATFKRDKGYAIVFFPPIILFFVVFSGVVTAPIVYWLSR